METGNLEFIITLVSIIGTVLAAFGFLQREMRRGFDRVDRRFAAVDKKFDRIDEKFDGIDKKFDRKFDGIDKKFDRIDKKFDRKFDGLRAEVTAVRVSVARIEGHLGIAFAATDLRAEDAPPERAA
jgi:Skp family chaperone for outer membrane proteins